SALAVRHLCHTAALKGQRRKTLGSVTCGALNPVARSCYSDERNHRGEDRESLGSVELLRWPRYRGPTTMRPILKGRELVAARSLVAQKGLRARCGTGRV